VPPTVSSAVPMIPCNPGRPQPAKHPVLTREQRKVLVRKCVCSLGLEEPHVLSAWFNFVPMSMVNRDNFVEWFYWAIFSSTVEDGKEFLSEVEEYLTEMEQRDGIKLIPGHTLEIKSIRVTLDPVRTSHRPLIWYLVCISRPYCENQHIYCDLRYSLLPP
jgi:hypothetical protein